MNIDVHYLGGRSQFPYIDEVEEGTVAADEEASTATNSPVLRHGGPKAKGKHRRRTMSADNTGSGSAHDCQMAIARF